MNKLTVIKKPPCTQKQFLEILISQLCSYSLLNSHCLSDFNYQDSIAANY